MLLLLWNENLCCMFLLQTVTGFVCESGLRVRKRLGDMERLSECERQECETEDTGGVGCVGGV